MSWPPTVEDFERIAVSAADDQNADCKVLVYLSSPEIMIIDPLYFANTEYIEQTWQVDKYKINIIIGRVD
jgi:hypothetical protein